MENNLERFRNKLIVFEGSDKTGKTSVAKALVNYLNANGIPTIFTFQPGDSNYGIHAQLYRSMCIDSRWGLHSLTNLFIFLADKIEQVSKIVLPQLQDGKTVVCDRWWYSTYAYQFYGKGLYKKYDKEFMDYLNYVSVFDIEPDIVYYFSVTLDIERDRDVNDMFENVDDNFIDKVNLAYEKLAREHGFTRIEPDKSVEKTMIRIIEND